MIVYSNNRVKIILNDDKVYINQRVDKSKNRLNINKDSFFYTNYDIKKFFNIENNGKIDMEINGKAILSSLKFDFSMDDESFINFIELLPQLGKINRKAAVNISGGNINDKNLQYEKQKN